MASPIQGRLTLFRVRKAPGAVGPVEGIVFCFLPLNPQLCCCSCCRHHPRWGDSASLLGNYIQQCGGPAVPGHGPEACPLQRGDLAGQQAGAPGGDQEADDAAEGSLGGKHGAPGGLVARGKGWCRATCMLLFLVSFKEELLTPLKRSHSVESRLQATTSGSFDSGVAGLSSSSQLTNRSDLSQTEGIFGSLLCATCFFLLEDGGSKG